MVKSIVKWFLLAFVATAVLIQITKSFRTVEETTFVNGKHLVFFHAKVRCPTCTAMERLIKQTLDIDFKSEMQSNAFVFHILDYESPKSKRLVEKYKVATATVLLFEQRNGEFVNGRNMAESCWKLIGDEPAFKKMIKKQLEDFLSGNKSKLDSESEEIDLAPDLNLFDEDKTNTTKEDKK